MSKHLISKVKFYLSLAVVRGLIIVIFSAAIMIAETYFLILDPLINGYDNQLSSSQYWAIVLPIYIIVGLLALTSGWVGYTMITTPEPVRFDYEEAYEVAKIEVDENTKD